MLIAIINGTAWKELIETKWTDFPTLEEARADPACSIMFQFQESIGMHPSKKSISKYLTRTQKRHLNRFD